MARMLIVIVALGAFCSGLNSPQSANDQFIQGEWRLAGEQKGGEHAWLLEWRFDGGTFRHSGYPPIGQEGKYRILMEREDVLELELYDQNGTFGPDVSLLKIRIRRDNDTLRIDDRPGFKRVTAD